MNENLEATIAQVNNGLYIAGPQRTGLFLPQDLESSLEDSRSITVSDASGNLMPLVVPIELNSEANHVYFEGRQGYFLNSAGFREDIDYKSVMSEFADLAVGSCIMIERVKEDDSQDTLIRGILARLGIKLELDGGVFDDLNGSLAAVHHFYSPMSFSEKPAKDLCSLREAYQWLVETGVWDDYLSMGVDYVSGVDINPSLMDELWEVYDGTFDALVSNHPSAQKQPKEDFYAQCAMPESSITYARDDEGICSALFLIDDIKKCNWLNPLFFSNINTNGETVFVPGISTKLSKQGMSYSPKIISAMANVVNYVPSITGFATQCTNRSADYIPRIAEESTTGGANLCFEETACYEYPVYVMSN